jgi:hypothetical protein
VNLYDFINMSADFVLSLEEMAECYKQFSQDRVPDPKVTVNPSATGGGGGEFTAGESWGTGCSAGTGRF